MNQSSKRLFSAFLGFLFLIAAVVAFFDLVQPEYNAAKNLQSQQIGEQNYLTTQTATVKQVQTVLNAYQNDAQNATNVNLAMPSGEDVAGALAQIQGIAENTGIAITSISATPPRLRVAQLPAAASATSTQLMKPLGTFTFTLAASGSYEQFKSFLQDLETNIRIFDVQAVTLQQGSAAVVSGKTVTTRDIFNYSITVATYYQTQ